MKLGAHSKNRILNTFAQWDVPKDYAYPLYNYLVHGFPPGQFWHFVLINDFAQAILSSHPANTVAALKNTVGWLVDTLPRDSEHRVWGSQDIVDQWIELSDNTRREKLESLRLIYKGEEEILLILKETPTTEPFLW